MYGDVDGDIRGLGSGDLWPFITTRDLVCLELYGLHCEGSYHSIPRFAPSAPSAYPLRCGQCLRAVLLIQHWIVSPP